MEQERQYDEVDWQQGDDYVYVEEPYYDRYYYDEDEERYSDDYVEEPYYDGYYYDDYEYEFWDDPPVN